MTVVADTTTTQALAMPADTVAADTVVTHKAIMLTYPHPNRPPEPAPQTFGFSAVVLLLILVFTAVCLRFRNNVKYVKAIIDDLVEVRLRHNIFDDTVRETSFLVMLNALWSLSAGIIVYAAIPVLSPFWREAGFTLGWDLSLLCLCYPEYGAQLLWVALGSFAIAKIIFIWKGFRIFFTQISSWVLFLYYLCSLEIVPLVITFVAALQICAFVGS